MILSSVCVHRHLIALLWQELGYSVDELSPAFPRYVNYEVLSMHF